jgi:hypothetical protein
MHKKCYSKISFISFIHKYIQTQKSYMSLLLVNMSDIFKKEVFILNVDIFGNNTLTV